MGKKHENKKHAPHKHKEQEIVEEKHAVPTTQGPQNTLHTLKNIFWNEKALIIVMLLIAIVLSTFFRMYPATLPITDQWAEDSYYNQVRAGIAQQINTQYPNLPQAQKDKEIEKGLQEYIAANGEQLQPQIETTSQYFKDQMQNENGQTYLLAIDPYHWLNYAKNYQKYGTPGDINDDGINKFSLRNGREGNPTSPALHSLLITKVQQIGELFNKNFTLLKAAFIMPVLIIALAIIFAFFLGRKIAGNLAGFIAGLIVALNTALLGRTPAGFSDTDAYIILFPLLISWMFIESLTAKKLPYKILFAGIAGLAYSLFSITWGQSWHIASILLGVAGIYFVYSAILERKEIIKKKYYQNIFSKKTMQPVIIALTFIVAIFIFATILSTITQNNSNSISTGINAIDRIITRPLSALSVKSVASADIWPNVLTTVAELNEGSWPQIINSLGGKLFFIIGIIGILLTFTLRTENNKFEIRYAALLGLWSIVLIAAGLMSTRFIALLAAPFAIAFGAAFGILWQHAKKIQSKDLMIVGRVALVIIVGLLFISPISQAHRISLQEVPSMNDAWYDSLIAIKNDTEDGIITSWWDFGHWFVNVAERRVTFDGGGQGKRIYWVGKSLMTDDLEENKAILRMLNCGQNLGYERLLEHTGNNYQASVLINEIIMESKENASAHLSEAGLRAEETNAVLEKTHCSNEELLPQYVIASQDMIGKAGVWAHFGGWDFKKAYVYNLARKNNYDEAMNIMQNKLGYDEETAAQLYFEANSLTSNREVDSWISPWPSYITSSSKPCQETNETIVCTMNQGLGSQGGVQAVLDKIGFFKDNPKNMSMNIAQIQNGVVVAETQVQAEKLTVGDETGWKTYELEGTGFPYEIVVGKTADGTYRAIAAEDAVADSAFSKLFFFDGTGMTGYEKLSDKTSFRGERILVYKVDLNN